MGGDDNIADIAFRGLYDPSLEKDACGVGFAWYAIYKWRS